MRRFIKNLGFFILFTVVIYSMLLIFWGDYMPDVFKKNLVFPMGYGGHLFTRIRDIPNFKNVDILVLGTSHAYRGFDVRILKEYGYNAFNLGSSFQTPVESLLLLEKFVDTLNPKIIIFDIYPPTFESDGVESSLDLIANYEVNKKILNMAITLNNIKTYNSLIYGYYRQSFNKDMNFKEPLDNGTDKYVSGGFVERKKIEFFLNKDKALNKHKWKPKKYQLNAFEKIINLAKNKNIQLIFVQSPTTSYRYEKYNNNNEIDEFISSKGDYYNFNKLISLSDSVHFFDDSHLNQLGVQIFNDSLVKCLFANNLTKKPIKGY